MTHEYIPRHSQSSNYVEWRTRQDGRDYCVIQEEGDIWTVMQQTSLGQWIDSAFDLDLFLDYYHLVLL